MQFSLHLWLENRIHYRLLAFIMFQKQKVKSSPPSLHLFKNSFANCLFACTGTRMSLYCRLLKKRSHLVRLIKNLNYNSKLILLHSLPNVRLTGLGGWLSKTRVQVSCADSHTRQVFRKTTLERTELKTLCSACAQDTLLWTSWKGLSKLD